MVCRGARPMWATLHGRPLVRVEWVERTLYLTHPTPPETPTSPSPGSSPCGARKRTAFSRPAAVAWTGCRQAPSSRARAMTRRPNGCCVASILFSAIAMSSPLVQRPHQRQCILGGLGDAGADVGTRDEGGVANQCTRPNAMRGDSMS
jgi:hypothetical protein